jgi:hypothetical protein
MHRWLLGVLVVVAIAGPAGAQGLPATGGLDKFMKDSAAQAQQKELQGLIERKRSVKTPGKKPPAKKAKHAPAGATDFTPGAGHPTVDAFLAQTNVDANTRQQLRTVFDATLGELGKVLRPNSVASGMGFALGVSIEIASDVEIPQADAADLVTGINDMLAASAEFKKLGSPERQALYEAFVMTGAMLSIIKAAGESDPAMKAQAKDMAKNVISQLSGVAGGT